MVKRSPATVQSYQPRSSGPDRLMSLMNSWKLHPRMSMSAVRSHASSKTSVAGQIQKLSVVAGGSGRIPPTM